MPVGGRSNARGAKLSTTDSMFTALGTTLQIVKDVGEALEGIPYVKSFAGILVQILKIREEILHLKEFSQELIELIAERALPLLRELEGLEAKSNTPGLESVKKDLEAYCRVLNDVYSALAQLTTRRRLFNLRHRDEIKSNLERYRRKLDDIHATFSVSRLTQISTLLVEVHARTDDTITSIGNSLFPEPLPPPQKVLIGRASEVEQNLVLLKSHRNPHIAIVGSGGMGKTSLAITLLHHPDMVALFSTSRYFVSCEKVTTFSALINAIADVLSIIPTKRGPTLQRDVRRHLGSVPTLLCLDNFEDPWDALGERREIATFLGHLDTLPHLGLILTSRVSERPPDISWTNSMADSNLRPLQEDDAVALFHQISKSSDPSIRNVVNAVDRLPLAIELLARQVGRDTMATFLDVWESEGLNMLDGGSGLDHRLSSVNASIRLSLLSLRVANHPSASIVLGLLATLPEGLASSMIDHVQSFLPSTILLRQSLRVLFSASLVYKDSTERYRILAPIRQYAEEYIPLEHDLMRAWTFSFAELINVDPKPYQSTHFHSTTRELSNVEAMILKGLPLWEGKSQVADVVLAATHLVFWQHYVALPNLDVIHTALQYARSPSLQGRCYRTLGFMLLFMDELGAAEDLLLRAISLFHGISDIYWEGMSWLDLGDVHMCMEWWGESESDLKRALFMSRQVGDLEMELDVLVSLGRVFWQDGGGRYGDAEATLLHALAISAGLAVPPQAQHILGQLYLDCFRFDKAEAHFMQDLQQAKNINDISGQALSHLYLGQVYTAMHVHPAAEASFQEAVVLFRRMKNTADEALAHLLLGQLYFQMHHLDTIASWPLPLERAAEEFSVSLSLDRQLNAGYATEEEAERCLHFLELPMFDLSFDNPDPIVWEPVEEPYQKFITRILGDHGIPKIPQYVLG